MRIFILIIATIMATGCTSKGNDTSQKLAVSEFEGFFLTGDDLPGYKNATTDDADSSGSETEKKKAGILKSISKVWIKTDMVADSRALFETEKQAVDYYSASEIRGKKEFNKTRSCPVKGLDCSVFSGEVTSPDKQTVISGSSCLFRYKTVVGRIFIATKKTSVNLDDDRIDNLCRKAAEKIMRKQ